MREIEKFHESFKLNLSEKDVIEVNGNKYLSIDYEGSICIRNFCTHLNHIDIDEYFSPEQLSSFNKNSYQNKKLLISSLNTKKYQYNSSVVILCSPYIIDKDILENPLVVGVNESLRSYAENIDIYMCNNSHININQSFPSNNVKKWPEGLFAYRTNPHFIKMYKGLVNGYNVPQNMNRTGLHNINNHSFCLEDHRSIILSAFNLIYYLGIRNVVLVNLENYIKEERPGTVYIRKGVYMYPQQIIDTSIINAGAYWLNKYEIKVFTTNEVFDFASNIKHIEESEIINGEI